MLTTTEETIEKTCNAVLGTTNGVERVKKIRDYAFVHFRNRDDALKVRDKLNGESEHAIRCVHLRFLPISYLRSKRQKFAPFRNIHPYHMFLLFMHAF